MMNKNSVFIVLLCLITAPFNVVSKDNLIKDIKKNAVNDIDIDAMLSEGPITAQYKLLLNYEKFKTKVEQLYLTKALSHRARQENLGGEPADQARLQLMEDRYYSLLALNKEVSKDLPDFEDVARLEYDSNKEKYQTRDEIEASHILIGTHNKKPKEALKSAQEVLAKLNKGEKFAVLAKGFSDDPSVKINNGYLNRFGKKDIASQFWDAAFGMKENEISKPIKTRYGYHLIKLKNKYPSRQKTFDEAKQPIIEKLKKKYLQTKREEVFEGLKQDNQMQIDEVKLKAFVETKLKAMNAKSIEGKMK